ncbi:tetratricopeptide repeat protein [Mangrovimicrobium sediminis]|uniref:Tetratricopeptide repeat protein n=1 Tax=Mangrovimicrobium sediminis TaxID=2562682 RepID=A0A4Z0M8C0_9GAMM|nr:CDC27 family protein [Haliea sp. SAOS-164]TGD75769.1 tetratricopeptide repeat protein [Haliea sp. SAOS-164]
MTLLKPTTWTRAALLALPVLAAQVAVSQLQSDLGATPFAAAVAQEKQADQRETRRTPALRNQVYEKLSEAQTAVEAKDMATAQKILDDMLDDSGKRALNSYELANVWNLYAFVYYDKGDFANALKAYENVVKQPDIPLAMEINTRFTIAQLYFVQEQWQRGINALNEWFKMTDTPNPEAYVLLAQGYYQLKQFDKSLANVEKAISMHNERQREKPAGERKAAKEQWYNLARFLYFEKNNVPKTVEMLEILIQNYPKKEYWVQLSHMYGEQKKETEQLAAMETAYVQGMLDKGSELVTMAYLYLNREVPYKAAKVMDQGLTSGAVDGTSKNWEITGSAWRQAQEVDKAIPAMEKAAAKSSEGELYARLGNIYLDGDQFRKSVDAIDKGLARGGVRRPDTAYLVKGMAYFNLKEYDSARKAFQMAARDKRSEEFAKQWLKYMDSELERQRSLAEG